ncbi:hypothetical protein RKD45_005448 [Streptomyces griseus]
MVDEDAVAAGGQVERDVLVRLLAAGAAVGLPHVDGLAVLHVRREALTEAVDGLPDAEVELGEHVVAAVVDGGERAALAPGRGQDPAVPVEELQAEGALGGEPQGERAAGQLGGRALGAGRGGGLR